MVNRVSGFPVSISLTSTDPNALVNAGRAVRAEYRATTRWKRLRCRDVKLLDNDPEAGIYVLNVGSSVEFDWTWEGAFAFRPSRLTRYDDTADFDRIVEDRYDESSEINWYGK